MNTKKAARELAFAVAKRANDLWLPYQMGAVLVDSQGVFSWGWNHRGDRPDYFSIHAERHAVNRANPKRVEGSTLYVAGSRRETGRVLIAKPCEDCQFLLTKRRVKTVWYSTPDGWKSLYL